uniref:Uncharacterized protein n=1 Tax=Neobacillus citreus TaxID=2833578 RepID=A0A942T0M4_9BACI
MLGTVASPIGVLIALLLEFMVQINYVWGGMNHGGGAAGPQIVAIVLGLAATIPALIASIRVLKDRAFVGMALAATVVSSIGLLAVVLLIVVPAVDVLPRAARDERAYREQQRREELDDLRSGYGPGSAERAGERTQPYVADALETLGTSPAEVEKRTWFSAGTTRAGNRCREYHERIDLPANVDSAEAHEALRASWDSESSGRSFFERPGALELSVLSTASTITYVSGENQLLVASECIAVATT